MDLAYIQGTLFSSPRTSLSYFSILFVPFASSFLLSSSATHLQKISQGSSLTPGLLAPLSSSPVHSAERYLAQVGSRSSARAQDQPLNRCPFPRTMNFALIIGCVAVTGSALNGKCTGSAREKSNLLSSETEEIVVQLERNNCHREHAVTA